MVCEFVMQMAEKFPIIRELQKKGKANHMECLQKQQDSLLNARKLQPLATPIRQLTLLLQTTKKCSFAFIRL